MKQQATKKSNFALIMILYLAGIFMGAIDTGIVTPARTIIQNQLGVEAQTGIWMITIYTLAYAASVPIMGKLADKFGRKYVYIICISLFGLGSLLCGLSSSFGGFPLLIAARVIQATGGGGIVPIATAEFGTTFPQEKRGLALGLVGGVYGIANVFGASAGSAILDLFGKSNWQFIFYINVPISLFIIICGLFVLENNRDEENNKRIDIFGIFTLTVMVLALLYGLKNLDFFDFGNSILSTGVYPFLLVFLAFIPLFIFAEKKAEDPVLRLSYFTERNILITLLLSTISGFLMMSVIFVPQFSENCLHLASGSGGYLVIALGLFAGLGAPVSGKLIDKFGPKLILAFGFLSTAVGALFMMFVTTKYPSLLTVLVGLAFAGLGMGFTMGTPVNYMMLEHTDPKESNSALAALSLVRSIGTAIAPAIMAGFLAAAGTTISGNLMAQLPTEIKMPELPHMQELSEQMDTMKQNPQFADMFEGMPDLSAMTSMQIDMSNSSGNSNVTLPDGMLEKLQNSDVTTIVDVTKEMATAMFKQMAPLDTITDGIQKGIDGIQKGIDAMSGGMPAEMPTEGQMPPDAMSGATSMTAEEPSAEEGAPAGMPSGGGMPDMSAMVTEMKTTVSHMEELRDALPGAFDEALENYLKDIDARGEQIETTFRDTLNEGFFNIYLLSVITAAVALLVLAFYKSNKKPVEA